MQMTDWSSLVGKRSNLYCCHEKSTASYLCQLMNHILVLALAFPRLKDSDGAAIFGAGMLQVPVKASSQHILPPLTAFQDAVLCSHPQPITSASPLTLCGRCCGISAHRGSKSKENKISCQLFRPHTTHTHTVTHTHPHTHTHTHTHTNTHR